MLDVSSLFSALDYDTPTPRHIHIKKKLYAKAIYDNTSDTSDELSFKKGDILTVFKQNADGLEGWWLCSLHGQLGMCPGNRLGILNSHDSCCFSSSPPSSPCLSLAASTSTLNSSICSTDIYENIFINSGTKRFGNNSTRSASQTQLCENHNRNQQHHHSNTQHFQLRHQTCHNIRRSWHVSPNKRYGDVYVHNISQPSHTHLRSLGQHYGHYQKLPQSESIYQNVTSMMSNYTNNEFQTYDTPKPATPSNYDCPKNVCSTTISLCSTRMKGAAADAKQEETYDVPRPLNLTHLQRQISPSSSNSSLLTNDSTSLTVSSSYRSSLANVGDYDIPRRNPMPVRPLQKQLLKQHQTVHTNSMTYDFPLPSTRVQGKSLPSFSNYHNNDYNTDSHITKVLPLELPSALETLAKLQSATTTAIMRLLSFVSPNWRIREKLEPVVMEVKLSALRLRTALHDLTEFGEGSLGNATSSDDRSLAPKLRPLVRALRDAYKLIHDSSQTLDFQGGWTLDNLARSDDKAAYKPPDSLDQLIACAQTLTEDVRQTASFIQGNALLLFKRTLPATVPYADNDDPALTPHNTTATTISDPYKQTDNMNSIASPNSDWLEDYDYVAFESKDAAAKKNSALREAIPQNQKNNFDFAIKVSETTVMATVGSVGLRPLGTIKRNLEELTDKDKLVVRYYAKQISNHMGNLQQAIDSFLETVEKNQPPKFFIAYGKFVVVSAHNLVTIGDIVHRNVSMTDLREKILRYTDALSDALKACVTKSKMAAAHFPSVTAVQEMVDSVMDISHLAFDLKNSMLNAVKLSL